MNFNDLKNEILNNSQGMGVTRILLTTNYQHQQDVIFYNVNLLKEFF